jgi:hypothetical protein
VLSQLGVVQDAGYFGNGLRNGIQIYLKISARPLSLKARFGVSDRGSALWCN